LILIIIIIFFNEFIIYLSIKFYFDKKSVFQTILFFKYLKVYLFNINKKNVTLYKPKHSLSYDVRYMR